MAVTIDCEFNLFEEGRVYSGHHRKYILESAINTCYAPATRERINMREALGYFGHGRREIAGRLALPEVTPVKLPDGTSIIVENIPSNVTTAFEILKDGTVRHTQQILETEPGKIVTALHASKVGGFSWACGGVNGGSGGATRISEYHGMDYVMNPGFAKNRGFVLESAGNDMILESVARATGMDDARVRKWMQHWTATAILENAELQERIINAAIYEDGLREELEQTTALLEAAQQRLTAEETRRATARDAILEQASKTLIAIPEPVMHSLLNMESPKDFQEVVAFFEAAKRVNLTGLPLGDPPAPMVVRGHGLRRDPQYGEAAAAPEFE